MTNNPNKPSGAEQAETKPVNLEIVDVYVTNALVGKGVISADEASSLEQDRLDELIVRSAHDFKQLPAIVPKANINKARKILGLAVGGQVSNDKSNRPVEIQTAETEMRGYLEELRKRFPYIKGLMLCGSRFNPHKIPTKDSDVDAIVILEEGKKSDSESESGRKLVSELVEYTRAHKTQSGFEVELDDFYTASEYFGELKSDTPSTELKGKLVWGWDSSAIRYIGQPLNGQAEGKVNETTQTRLNAEPVKSQKTDIISKAKTTLLPEAQQMQSNLLQAEQSAANLQESESRKTEAAEISRIREGLVK